MNQSAGAAIGTTLGEQRIRTTFNPSQSDVVSTFKQKSAELINLIEEYKKHKSNDGAYTLNGEFVRLCSLAQTEYESAAMWIVKAITL